MAAENVWRALTFYHVRLCAAATFPYKFGLFGFQSQSQHQLWGFDGDGEIFNSVSSVVRLQLIYDMSLQNKRHS